MKKNLLVALLSVTALSTLPGCGEKKVVTEETTTTVETTPVTTEEVTVEETREATPVEEEAK